MQCVDWLNMRCVQTQWFWGLHVCPRANIFCVLYNHHPVLILTTAVPSRPGAPFPDNPLFSSQITVTPKYRLDHFTPYLTWPLGPPWSDSASPLSTLPSTSLSHPHHFSLPSVSSHCLRCLSFSRLTHYSDLRSNITSVGKVPLTLQSKSGPLLYTLMVPCTCPMLLFSSVVKYIFVIIWLMSNSPMEIQTPLKQKLYLSVHNLPNI